MSCILVKKISARLEKLNFILVLGLGIALALAFGLSLPGVSLPPSEVRIANVTDSSLAISWVTDKPTQGGIVLSTQQSPILRRLGFFACSFLSFKCWAFGDEIANPGTTHLVFLKNLTPQKPYYYRIFSGGRLWKFDKEGKILPSLETAPILENLSLPNPFFSRIYKADGKTPLAGALVYISLIDSKSRDIIKSQPLTTYTDQKGVWLTDLGNLRSFDLKQTVTPAPGDLLFIKVWAPDGKMTAEFVNFYQTEVTKPIILR